MPLIKAVSGEDAGWSAGSGSIVWTLDADYSNCLAVAVCFDSNNTLIPTITADVGPMGYTLPGNAYASGGNYSSGFAEPDVGLGATSGLVRASMASGVIPPGTTQLAVTNGSAAPNGGTSLLIFDTENTCHYYQEADVDFDTAAGEVPFFVAATPVTPVDFLGDRYWFSVLCGVTMHADPSDPDAFVHEPGLIHATFSSVCYGDTGAVGLVNYVKADLALDTNIVPVTGDHSIYPDSPSDVVWEFVDTGVSLPDLEYRGYGRASWLTVGTDFTIDPFPEPEPEPGGFGAEPFEFTHRWPLLGPLLLSDPTQACDLLERHDQELEEHFATHGCGDFEYTFRWPTFYQYLLVGDRADAVRIMETRDQELELASAHQGEGEDQVNDGTCQIELTHRWAQIIDLVRAGDARAWDLLEMRDQEIEASRSACACEEDEDPGEG